VARPDVPALSPRELSRTLRVLLPALAAADEITLGRQHRVAIHHKLDGSEVTAADKGAERLLRRHLRAAWPDDSVLGEEYGGAIAQQGRTWLLDPIDGTASYVLGLATFGTLVALLIDGEPVFGCIHLPAMRETTYAATGHGCWLRRGRGRAMRVHVAAPKRLKDAQIGLTSLKRSDLHPPPGPWRISALTRAGGRIRLVGDCVQYTLLCRGQLDVALDPAMNPWDIAPLVVCVREAGGGVGDLTGNTRNLLASTSFIATSSEALRRAVCAHVSGPPEPESVSRSR